VHQYLNSVPAVAVTVQLPTNYPLYQNRPILSAQSLHRWTPLSSPGNEFWSCPFLLLYIYHPTSICISTEQHCPPTYYKKEHLYVHQDLIFDPKLCVYCTTNKHLPALSQQFCTVRQLTTKKNTVKCTSTWPVIQPVAVTVQLPTNCVLYLNRFALPAHSLHKWTRLSAPVTDLWSSPLPLLCNYQPTAWSICPPTHYTDEHR